LPILTDETLLAQFSLLALEAGAKAMEIYARDFSVTEKNDASPVTEADKLGEEIIVSGLKKLAPTIPILAEEAASEGNIPELGDEFFLVDPLDGTREFINRTGEFTVNIALIRHNTPVIGVVYAPAIGKIFGGSSAGAFVAKTDDKGAMLEQKPIKTRPVPAQGLTAVASRSHRSKETDDFLKTLNVADFAAAGSSLKFCLIAEGIADVYPRLGRTMEWDTGAGQAVLEAAGGRVTVFGCNDILRYRKEERSYDNPHFIAWGQ